MSYDKTNFTTTGALAWTVIPTGITNEVAFTNFDRSRLDNVRAIRLTGITNANIGSITVSNVVWSVYP